MKTTEHTINDALAAVLRTTRRAWRESDIVRSEQLGTLKESFGRPNILIVEPNVSPVAIEVEIHPAVNVESEALSRLGKWITTLFGENWMSDLRGMFWAWRNQPWRKAVRSKSCA